MLAEFHVIMMMLLTHIVQIYLPQLQYDSSYGLTTFALSEEFQMSRIFIQVVESTGTVVVVISPAVFIIRNF